MTKLILIKKRPDFVHVTQDGFKVTRPGFVLQAAFTKRIFETPLVRIGFTASKKVGNAVCRARAKRRLRPLAQKYIYQFGIPGVDYVYVARSKILEYPADKLESEFQFAIWEVNKLLRKKLKETIQSEPQNSSTETP